MDVVATLKKALAGRYELEREIGAGGMATVYLARDVKHNRKVALKLLKPELGAVLGGERFLAEIQVTANLQHPNLLPLFDSGEVDGLLYYVMPFVDGETLRHRLDREKQLPVDEVLTIAVAVASALEYAHGHGVIHRDLKPENILIQAGQPVVADFGIALAVSNAGGQRVTQSGMSLGTPQYMSPEQATGDRAIDARSDIYSLGAVVYEMLTGEPPHSAPTAQATIAKLLTEDPRSIAGLRRTVPEHVDDAVLRALEKLPADRFASARVFADALGGKAHVSGQRTAARAASRRSTPRVVGISVVAAVIGVIAVFALWQVTRAPAEPERASRFPLAFQGDARYAPGGGIRLALSPDGLQLAYVAGGAAERLYLKRLGDLDPKPIAGTEGASNPQFSPDGQWIAFLTNRTLVKVRLPGGVAESIADSVDRFSWGDGDLVVFARNAPDNANAQWLWRTSARGGPQELIASPDSSLGELNYSWPHLLPDARAALFNLSKGNSLQAWELAAIRLSDRRIVRFGIHGMNPRYVSTGHMLYSLPDRTVMAVAFDAKKLEVTGPPVPVLENVRIRGQGATQFAISGNGTLVYVTEAPPSQVVMADRAGRRRVLIADTLTLAGGPRLSPDGKRMAITRAAGPNEWNIWVYSFGTGALTQLTTDNRSTGPSWSADSRLLVWTDGRAFSGGTRLQPWDASQPSVVLMESVRDAQFSPTGRFLTAASRGGRFMTTLDAPQQRVQIPDADEGRVGQPHDISPDGKWIAYSSRGSTPGVQEVYVRAIPGPGPRHQISSNGGTEPRWGATSAELLFRNRGWLWSATLTTSPELGVARTDSLFEMNARAGDGFGGAAMWDVSRDGKSFVMHWFLGEENPPPVMVTGWFADLREKMAAAEKAR